MARKGGLGVGDKKGEGDTKGAKARVKGGYRRAGTLRGQLAPGDDGEEREAHAGGRSVLGALRKCDESGM